MSASSSSSTRATQFQATETWNRLVSQLYQNVEVKQKRIGKKKSSCFSGANAVDVLHHYVRHNIDSLKGFKSSNPSRDNVVMLCQKFADQGYLLPAEFATPAKTADQGYPTRTEFEFKFEDSKHSFYTLTKRAKDIDQKVSGSMDQKRLRTDMEETSIDLSKENQFPKRSYFKTGDLDKGSGSMKKVGKSDHNATIKHKGSAMKHSHKSKLEKVRLSMRRKSPNDVRLLSAKPHGNDLTADAGHESRRPRRQPSLATKSRQHFVRSTATRKSWSCKLDTAMGHVKRMLANPIAATSSFVPAGQHSMLRWKPSQNLSDRGNDTETYISHPKENSFSDDSFSTSTDNNKRSATACLMELEHSPAKILRSGVSTSYRLRSSIHSALERPPRPIKWRNLDTNQQSSQQNEDRKTISQHDLLRLRRQCVRVKLLQMIDMQFIDSLVESPPRNEPKNSFFTSSKPPLPPKHKRFEDIEVQLEGADPLTSAIFKLARRFAGRNELQENYEKKTQNKKIELFFWVRSGMKKVFKNESLFYSSFKDIMDEILLMISEKSTDETASALQLVILLLEDSRIEQVKDLIRFFACLKTDATFAILSSRRCNNFTVAVDEFLPIIFPNCHNLQNYKIHGEKVAEDFVRTRFEALINLMIEREDSIFEVPSDLAFKIKRKKELIESGEVDTESLAIDTTFAQKITVADYEQQKQNFTQMQLQKLVKSIATDGACPLSASERSGIVKEMRAYHGNLSQTKGSPHVNKTRSVSSLDVNESSSNNIESYV